MSAVSVTRVSDLVLRLASQPILESDTALLARFVKSRDEEALATLVERHGPLVQGVARRALGELSAVDDIVQATFITLARKAGSIRRGNSLSAWLHGTAHRLAIKHQARESSRRRLERRAAKPESLNSERAWHDLHTILDEEIQKMPAALRGPLLLCYFDGRTQDEAARQLELSIPTVRRRLEKGRALLRLRLERRGVAPALALTSIALTRKTISAAAARQIAAQVLAAPAHAEIGLAFANTIRGTSGNLAKAIAGIILVSSIFISGAGQGEPPASPATPAAQPADNRPEPRVDAEGVPLPEGALARVGSTRFRHGGLLGALAISPDGRTLASLGRPGGLAIWEAETGKLKRRIDTQGGERFTVNAIRFLTDGTIVAVNDQACYRVDPNGEVRTAIHTAPNTPNLDQACGVAVSPDGKRFAVGRWNKSIHFHDAASGNEIWHEAITEGLSEIYAAFSPDGKMLAVTANGSKAHLFDASTGKSLGDLDSDQPKIWSLEFSPDGRWLSTHAGRTDNTLRVWDLFSRTVRLRINDLDFFPQSVAYSADGKFIAASGLDKKVKLIDTADGKIVRSCPNPSMPYRLVFSPAGKTLVCANSAGFISLMDVGTGEIQKSADPFDGVFTARFTADGKKLALASDRFSIRDWRSGAIEHRFEPLGEVPLHWDMSSDCKFAAYSDPDGGVHVGEIETGKERMKLAPTKSWRGLFFSTDGSRLFVADINGRIDVVDVSTGMILKTLDGQLRNNLLFRLASSADGRWLAAASAGTVGQRDFDIRIWDLNAGNEFRRISPKFGPVSEMEFSPDSSMLAAVGGPREPQASPGSIELFDPASRKEIRHFDGHTWYVLSVAFSPDGRTLATGSRDNTVRLWEVATGTERRRIEGHSFYVKSVAFSPDGIRLVSTSYDAPVYVWDVYSPPSQPSKPSVNEIWDALHSSSAHLGAVGEMISNPNLAFELCRGRIKPVITPEKKMVQKLADALGDADYRVRDNAESDLARLGDVIEPALRRELGASPSAEKTSRLNRLLSKLATPSGDQLAALRAMEAIERIGDSRARKLMEEWAGGDPDCSFTRAAKQSLGRMKTR